MRRVETVPILLVLAAAACAAGGPLLIGPERQLFVDDYLIASTDLRRRVHAVEKYAGNPILLPVKPWEGQYALLYGTVLRDEEEGVWKMWYSTMHHFRYIQNIFPESTYLCYAVSRDGIRWEKPSLGLIDYRGSRENNIVFQAHDDPALKISGILDAVSILKDDRDPDRSRRYKMMIWHHNQRLVDGKWVYRLEQPYGMGHYVAFSPDGLRWRELPDPVFPYNPVRDTMTTMWDPRAGQYVAFVKQQVDGKRARFLSESADFLHWTPPTRMLAADAQDSPAVELYNNTGFYYQGMYLGLLTVFHPEPKDNIYLDIQLISSRDGRHWQRPGDRSPIIPAGRRDIDWDFGFQSPASGPPVRVGGELWFYYSGRSYRHPVTGQGREPNHGAIGLAKLRLDGFVSMDAGQEGGYLVTRPFKLADAGLYLNADAARGELRVEVLDETGKPVPGFARAGSEPVRASSVRHLARWGRGSSLAALKGRTVMLKFYLRNASLYSFAIDSNP
ncbi:MAG: hypothetical protein HY822_08245 [Acidobacteria bacterium]|nr:hypothetical protein [Acidobacteriota bacterium]